MTSSSKGWSLAQRSFTVVKANKAVIIYPMCTGLGIILIFLITVAPILRAQLFTGPWLIIMVLVYFFFYNLFLNISNAAIIVHLTHYYHGNNPKLKQGFATMGRCFWRIYLWTNVMTTIGNFIRFIQGWSEDWYQLKLVQKYLAGMHWRTAIYLTLPALIFKTAKVRLAIQHSAHLLAQTWGQSIRMNMTLSLTMLALRLASFSPLLATIYITGKQHLYLGASITVVLYLLVAVVNSSVQMALMAALYQYASGNHVEHFDEEALKHAFVKC